MQICRYAILVCGLLVGCSQAESPANSHSSGIEPTTPATTVGLMQSDAENPAAGAVDEIPSATTPPASTARRIVYNADIALVVEDFSITERQIPQLVEQHGGYLANITAGRSAGEHRSGTWVARIPVGKFNDFISDLDELGLPERRQHSAQDVTAEYVDLEARITNQQRLEERIIALLAEKGGKIEDILSVERELGRVREEIERMQGQLRLLANRTALSTVTINAREERNYIPPQEPTFVAQVTGAWKSSLELLVQTGKTTLIVLAAITPWALSLGVMLTIAWTVWRVRRRDGRTTVSV